MGTTIISIASLIIAFLLDKIYGDPANWPHPVVAFGNTISFLEKLLNKGKYRFLKGSLTAFSLVTLTYIGSYFTFKIFHEISSIVFLATSIIFIFFSLAGTTLRLEVSGVFNALNESTEKGRVQLSRIVGRDTSRLNPQQIRTAALETLAENLSDGVIAPLCWFAVLGVPGMLTYKMINTLDSMIGYKNDRYLFFGRFAARLDDVANFIPARLTALIMLLVSGDMQHLSLVFKNGKQHASPNSGYPEAALADILQCRFGGPNYYFGKLVHKPYIGNHHKTINQDDLEKALKINSRSEWLMLCVTLFIYIIVQKIISL